MAKQTNLGYNCGGKSCYMVHWFSGDTACSLNGAGSWETIYKAPRPKISSWQIFPFMWSKTLIAYGKIHPSIQHLPKFRRVSCRHCRENFTWRQYHVCSFFLLLSSYITIPLGCSRLGGCIPLCFIFPLHWCCLHFCFGIFSAFRPGIPVPTFLSGISPDALLLIFFYFWQDCFAADHGSFLSQEQGIPVKKRWFA